MRRAHVEQNHLGVVALFVEFARHNEGVAAVVARPGKHHNALVWAETRHYFACRCCCGSLHEGEAGHTVVFHCVTVNLSNFFCREYLHNAVSPVLLSLPVRCVRLPRWSNTGLALAVCFYHHTRLIVSNLRQLCLGIEAREARAGFQNAKIRVFCLIYNITGTG